MVRAGRRGGKTTGAAGLAVERFLGEMGTNRVLYAVPTADQIARFWHECVTALAEPIEHGVYKVYKSDRIIENPGTEQRIRAKTAWNADTLRGDYGDLIILDEYQLMNEDALQDVILPMLIDNNGDLVLIYTPPSLHSRSVSKATDKRHAAKLFKEKQNDPRWLCVHFTSHDNPHISAEGIEEVSRDMSLLSRRQEIEAEDLDEVPGALWKLDEIERDRVIDIPATALPLVRIVGGIDPTGSTTNEAGIVFAGLGQDGHGYVLRDESKPQCSPRQWASAAVWTYLDLKADRIVAEENYGGDMVKDVIETTDDNISYKGVDAARGKIVRAEPIHALYEKHVIHHVGEFPKLEEEMVSYVPLLSKVSPNRMDALVWALTDLFPQGLHFGVLGLAQSEAEELNAKRRRVHVTQTATGPTSNAASIADRCPACNSSAKPAQRGPIKHCVQCGHEWGMPLLQTDENGGRIKPRANLFDQ